jgi:hypothetical protein
MSSEAPKTAKEPFVPKYEIAAGLHKGRKLEKFVAKRVRPTRQAQVISFHCIHSFFFFVHEYRKKANVLNSFVISFVNLLVLCRMNDVPWN